mmetsp:Transcript_10788/g.23064  ORF Transcript_10788/g.23064 Transcript_10788/m.23064 type:complete len:450 (+) Transcript_10788:162-1511(+)|eukprot:CAMPEP_0171410694 /NCGR_PEP_ID=MMETSP0880-20121228/28133_1 /TAXON_ID=67004 /ORGANISM="Thalassiosira weissflogii, Strain CCMP1336" /LENGTH=449 /DNA_ID=CAMNT_0011927559 /DNA_START=32 /DNA_END=1381 /DNA_ORIENTATION=+
MKNQKPKAKRNDILVKPKRPMSAYNFFFRAERVKILDAANKNEQDGESIATSFEDIGRIIGKRWREISDEEHIRYKEMATEDSNRYQAEMKTYYKDELTLMCLGHNTTGVDVECKHYQTNSSPRQAEDEESSRSDNRFAKEAHKFSDAPDIKNKSMASPTKGFENKKPSADAPLFVKNNNNLFGTPQNPIGMENSPGNLTVESVHQSGIDPFETQAYMNAVTSASNSADSQQLMAVKFNAHSHAGNTNNVLIGQIMAQMTLIAQLTEELERERRISRMKDELLHQYINSSLNNDDRKPTAASMRPTIDTRASMQSPPNISASDYLSSGSMENVAGKKDRREYRNSASAPSLSASSLQGTLLEQQQQQQQHEQRYQSCYESTLQGLFLQQSQQQCEKYNQTYDGQQQQQHQEEINEVASRSIQRVRSQYDAADQVNGVIEFLSAQNRNLK